MSSAVTSRASIAAISRLIRWVWLLLVVVPTVSLSAEFRTAKTGSRVDGVALIGTSGSRLVPGGNGWQLVVTVSPGVRTAAAVCRDLERLAERIPPGSWSPLLVITGIGPGEAIPFDLPAGQEVVFDPDRAWYERLGLFVFPATALFDAEGVLRWQRSGHFSDWLDITEDTLRHHLGLPGVARGASAAAGSNPEAERHYRLGVALEKDGRFGDALAALDSALLLDRAFGKAHLERAEVCRQYGQAERASESYRAALEADSSLYRAWVGIGLLELESGSPGNALAAADRALAVNSRSGDALTLKSRCLITLKQFGEAEVILRRLLPMSPGRAEVNYLLGRVFEASGKTEEAFASYREALRLLLRIDSD